GYRGLVVSDDMEMGAVLKTASIEQIAVEFIRAGGDLCLICRQEELIVRAHEALIREAERDRKFARRVAAVAGKIMAFKKKSVSLRRRNSTPSPEKIEKLTQQLHAFAERVTSKIPAEKAAS